MVNEDEFSKVESVVKRFAQPATLEKIDTYKSSVNRQRKLLGEMLAYKGLQQCFGIKPEDIIFEYGPKGKPALKNGKGMFFNITHSGDWVVCGVSDREIGVDIEVLKKARMNVAGRFFTAKELDKLSSLADKEQDDYFYLLWTAKESYLKYLGTGLTKPLNSFDVICEEGVISVNESDFSLQLKFSEVHIDDSHKTIVCSGQDVTSVDIIAL